MSDRFHINPQTGNPGVCRAKYSCRFGGSEEHFDSKVEAREDYEMRMSAPEINEVKAVRDLKSEIVLPETTDWNQVDFRLKAIQDWPGGWTVKEKENLASVLKLNAVLSKENMTDADWETAHKLLSHMNPQTNKSPSAYGKDDAYLRRDANLIRLAEDLMNRKRAYDYPESTAPKREKFDAIIGLAEAQKAAVISSNVHERYKDEPYITIHKDAEKYLDRALDRIAAGEKYETVEQVGSGTVNNSLLPERDRLFRLIANANTDDANTYNNQLYLATAFPERELKDAIKRAGLENITVSHFANGREDGLAYTVMTPDGGSRTFSVYEHRNSDSIIINGKANWKHGDLPYSADSKNQFFAEFAPDDKKQAADALVFFMKDAQRGDIDNDADLASKVERRDWRSILSESIPGYGEWVDKTFPDNEITEDPRKLGF